MKPQIIISLKRRGGEREGEALERWVSLDAYNSKGNQRPYNKPFVICLSAWTYRAELNNSHRLQYCQQNWLHLMYLQPSQITSRPQDYSRAGKIRMPPKEANRKHKASARRDRHKTSSLGLTNLLVLNPHLPRWTQKKAHHREQSTKRPLLLQCFPIPHSACHVWSKRYPRRNVKANNPRHLQKYFFLHKHL